MISDDHNFKNLILDYGLQALQFFAPREMEHVPPNARITPLRQEQTKERLGDRFYELDVALEVEFPNGQSEAVVFCIEEESRVEKLSWRRHAIYCLQLSELRDTTRVVPIVIYPFAKESPKEAWQLATERDLYLDFRCLVVTLGKMKALDHVRGDNLVEQLCLPLMKFDASEKFAIILRALEALATLEPNWDRRMKYFGFVTHYGDIRPDQQAEFIETYVERSPQKEHIMVMRNVFEQVGFDRGYAVGAALAVQGELRGRANSIVDFYKAGVLSLDAARSYLEKLIESDPTNRAVVEEALQKLTVCKSE